MTTYELTTGTREEFNTVQTQLINDLIQQITNTEVTANCRAIHTGRIVSCLNPSSNFESVIASVYFDDTDETKNYGIVAAINCGGLLFVDESVKATYDEFVEAYNNLKHQYSVATDEARRLEREAQKKAEREKKAEANYEKLKTKSIKAFEELTQRTKPEVSASKEFYCSLGWLAKHVGSIQAVLPDYLESAFEKYFGTDAPKRLIDSKAKTSGGYAKQWSWEFRCTIKGLDKTTVPANLLNVTSDFSKGIHNTSFLWDLVTNYGFKFGKVQDKVEIMRHVPIEYIPAFNEGYEI
jgi:hypothetical protein